MMMDTASAELCKYAANSILATRISFMNEIANVCELVGADVDQVRKAIGSDRRIGTSFLFPGVGYGGSCFPEGRQGAAQVGGGQGLRLQDPATRSRTVNDAQKQRLVEKMEAHFGDLDGQDDRAVGAGVQAADRRHARGAGDSDHRAAARRWARRCAPTIRRPAQTAQRHLRRPRSRSASKSYDALAGADALAIVTEWNEFREPDFEKMRSC